MTDSFRKQTSFFYSLACEERFISFSKEHELEIIVEAAKGTTVFHVSRSSHRENHSLKHTFKIESWRIIRERSHRRAGIMRKL